MQTRSIITKANIKMLKVRTHFSKLFYKLLKLILAKNLSLIPKSSISLRVFFLSRARLAKVHFVLSVYEPMVLQVIGVF
jgi:hypothetical protein